VSYVGHAGGLCGRCFHPCLSLICTSLSCMHTRTPCTSHELRHIAQTQRHTRTQ
jgi:hypothetical protein